MRSRKQQIKEEKGTRPDHMTSGQLADYLGISPRTFRRRRAAGTIPDPVAHTAHGWGLWSPAQQEALLRKEARLDDA